MTRITPDHLSRAAWVYVRQSTPGQVRHNLESQGRQYALRDRAHQLGWSEVVVVDDDLGRSGGGTVRPGYDRLLAAVCRGEVGVVLSLEASRLARNGREWHTLLDYCGLVGCLLADESSVYDPRLPNDRLLLGMKGTMSEMELSTLRHRSEEALRRKAGRGELFMTVAVGYVRVDRDRIGMDPDQRVREAVALVFRKFAELGSIRQVHLWLRHEGIELPALVPGGSAQRIEWKLPVYNSIHHMLTNPVYAGAYAFGRTGTRTYLENGHKRVVHGIRRRRDEWEVLIRDHHDGYITWAEYERNQKVIADNANCQGAAARGSIRQGEALLAGLVRCGHCGRNLHVTYPGDQRSMARYACRGGHVNHGTELCISFGGLRVDRAVGEAVLHVLRPLGIEAALKAIEERRRASCEVLRQAELALEAARFEEQHARRQYDAVDPDNRLVASELERRWNERLEVVRQREEAVSALLASREQEVLGPDERDEYLALGADLERAWNHERATAETRKRIVRALLVEVVANIEGDRIRLRLHWHGGDHTELTVRKNRSGQHRWTTDAETGDLIRELARLLPDRSIASLLNRVGKRTGKGNPWTEARVRAFRASRGIVVYREGERQERNELTLQEASERLGVSKMTVLRQIRRGVIPARQACKGAPWVIGADALERAELVGPDWTQGPVTADPLQETLEI